jgi:hypothetical protein
MGNDSEINYFLGNNGEYLEILICRVTKLLQFISAALLNMRLGQNKSMVVKDERFAQPA